MAKDEAITSCSGIEHQHENNDAPFTSFHHNLPTLSEIKLRIPGHCFRSSVRKSTFYALWDIFVIALVYMLMTQLECKLKCGYLLYPLYWYVEGKTSPSRTTLETHCITFILVAQVLSTWRSSRWVTIVLTLVSLAIRCSTTRSASYSLVFFSPADRTYCLVQVLSCSHGY